MELTTIEQYIESDDRLSNVLNFHTNYLHLINTAKGSQCKHQAWEGGYRVHIEQCLNIADELYYTLGLMGNNKFNWADIFLVIYFHDIEKIWKYTTGEIIDKEKWFNHFLPKNYNIVFTNNQKNGLKYIHGEGDDYCELRVMNELAAFCHCCDILSSRVFFDKVKINEES